MILRERSTPGAGDEFLLTAAALSNDAGYTGKKLWGMYGDKTSPANQYGSQAGEAWAAGHVGSTKVAVGVIDSGIDYTHADLYLNIWLNQGEIPTGFKGALVDYDNDLIISMRDLNASQNAAYVSDLNGNGYIDAGDLLADTRWENGNDQDGNGYIDDLIGWDFANNDNDPHDDHGHGTHVAGTIGAIGGNGIGVAGVAWNVSIVALKFIDASGSGSSTAAIKSIDYFTNASKTPHGIDFVATNNSWGGGGYLSALGDAIARGAARDILFVGAAGNGGTDSVGDDNDVTPHYPSNYDTTATAGYDAVVSVASITSGGARSTFSNYGDVTVDLGAPGSMIYSTLAGGGYGYMSGTSMATPHVAGAIALYAAANPGASAAEIRAALLDSTIDTTSLAGRTVSGGRLDVAAMLGGPAAEPGGITLNGTSGNDTLTGGTGDDALNGLAGHDTLDGGAGADTMAGGTGNDIFHVDNAGDHIVEKAGEGTDTARTSTIDFTLPDHVERLYLDGTLALSGSGNAMANQLYGNGAANLLKGLGGNDTLSGNAGNDRLEGGDGNDTLYGATGTDVLVGGAGADRFAWNSASHGGKGSARDQILDFAQGEDKLVLSGIDAKSSVGGNDAFSFIGSSAFSGAAGQLRFQSSGGATIVQGDVNGDGVADFEVLIGGFTDPLVAADFIL